MYRKLKENLPVLAVCYDFDRTLSPDEMQAQGYIQSVGYDVKQFWRESNELAKANDMDGNLAYMYKMVEEAEGHFVLNRKALGEYGSRVRLFEGVKEWFARVNAYGKKCGVTVEHNFFGIEGDDFRHRNCGRIHGNLRLSILF